MMPANTSSLHMAPRHSRNAPGAGAQRELQSPRVALGTRGPRCCRSGGPQAAGPRRKRPRPGTRVAPAAVTVRAPGPRPPARSLCTRVGQRESRTPARARVVRTAQQRRAGPWLYRRCRRWDVDVPAAVVGERTSTSSGERKLLCSREWLVAMWLPVVPEPIRIVY